LLSCVRYRPDRCSLERIFGCIFFTENPQIVNKKSVFGYIMNYQKWGYSYDDYEKDLKEGKIPRLVVKVWTGR